MDYRKKQRAYISYAKVGCGEIVADLTRALAEYGYGVLYDKKSPRSGVLERHIPEAITNCEWFILVLDKHIFEGYPSEGNWVHAEVKHALSEGKKIICVAATELELEKEIPESLSGRLFKDKSEIILYDGKNPHKTALKIREIIEADGGVGKFEKAVNRVFSGIYLWRIALFPLLGAFLMLGRISSAYAASSYIGDIGFIFEYLGTGTVFAFNLFFVSFGALLCGILMYVARNVLRLDLFRLSLVDIFGVLLLSAASRKLVSLILPLDKIQYWTSPIGNYVWNLTEMTCIYMVIFTVIVQLLLYLFKRSRNYV